MPSAKELAPIHEFPLPFLEVDLDKRIVKMGQRSVAFDDNPRWDLLLHFFQNPNTPVRSGEVFKTLYNGENVRQLPYSNDAVDSVSQVRIINSVFSDNLGFLPIRLSGKGEGSNYSLKAEIKLNGNIEDYLPQNRFKPSQVVEPPRNISHALDLSRMRIVGEDPRDAYFPSPLSVDGFDRDEQVFLKRVNSEGVLADSSWGSLVTGLNIKLERKGKFVTVVGGRYVLKEYKPPARFGGARRFV